MNYEQYHQKGGFYAIPVEIFDGLCEEKDKLQEENQQLKEQQKEFIDYLEKEIVDSRAGSSQYYSAIQHLKLFKEIIGSDKQ